MLTLVQLRLRRKFTSFGSHPKTVTELAAVDVEECEEFQDVIEDCEEFQDALEEGGEVPGRP